MTASITQFPHQLGDYTLKSHLGGSAHYELYRAVQTKVKREVIIELRRRDEQNQEENIAKFIASVKSRSRVRLPRTMQVYDCVRVQDDCFVVYELPQGYPLSHITSMGKELSVLSICTVIEQCAELYIQCQAAHLPTRALSNEMIYMESEENFFFLSPLCSAEDIREQASDYSVSMRALSAALSPLLPSNVEGASRSLTLVSWLYEGYEGSYLSWQSIQATARSLIEQVLPNWEIQKTETALTKTKAARDRYTNRAKKLSQILLSSIAGCLILLITGIFFIYNTVTADDENLAAMQPYIITLDGKKHRVRSTLVTIGEYKQFLENLPNQSASRLKSLYKGVPDAKRSQHKPAHWKKIVKEHNSYPDDESREKLLQRPITNIDYWDVIVYTRYTGAQLPSAAHLRLLKQSYPAAGLEEWSSCGSKHPLFGDIHTVLDSKNQTKTVNSSNNRHAGRGFRTYTPL